MAKITLKILMDDSSVKKQSEELKKVLSESFQPITKINTSGIENLRKSYANLLNTIKTNADKFPTETFKDVREQTELALSSVIELSEKLRHGGELSKEETEDYAKLSNQIKTLASDFATLRAQTERLEKVESERVPQINKLQKSYATLRTTLKSYSEQYGEEKFDGFSKDVQNALDSVTALKTTLGDTEPDEEQKRQLIELGHQFENLSSTIETVRANSDKLQKAPKEYIPDIDKLQSKYAQLLKRVTDLSSRYPSGIFADSAEDIKDALESMMNMPSVLSDKDKGELRFLEDNYDTLKASVNTVVAMSERLEKVDILNVSNQYSRLIEKINSIKEKYPEGTFDDIAESANAAFNEIRALNFTIGDGKPTDDQTKRIAELDQQYERLNNELNTAKVRTEKLQKEQKISAPSVDTLRTNIANLAASLKNLSSSYPSGTFTEISAKVSALLKRIQALNTEIGNQEPTDEQKKALNALQKEYQSLSGDIATVKATTDKYTGSIDVNGDSILSSAKKFMMWQSTATLVMTAINLLKNAFNDLNETLVSTEDKVIAIARVLPETGKSNAELADRLYDVGADYARNFEDVSEIAQNFAQSGYDFAETIQATEAAVLALNVAELTAEQSSEGLISVLAQFDKPVNELINVIDILNMTADKMPVTTEELLAGLQKTGSYAKEAKMDLKETTAILASLSKATAASGQQIGNALKSLIAYTTKTDALDLFAGMSEDLDKIVKRYRMGEVSILKVWQTLSEEMQSLSAEQLDLLDKFTNESGLENEIGAELTDIYEDLTGVYDTAGVYRKNYFIALMQELDKVDGIVEDISDSAGYSAKENEAYLESYTGKITTLQLKWQAMLNDEQGFLGFKKELADIGIWLVDATDKVGGLRTAFLLSVSAASLLFGEKAILTIDHYVKTLKKPELSVFNLKARLQKLTEAENASMAASKANAAAKNALAAADANSANMAQLKANAEKADQAATQANTAAQKAKAAALASVVSWISIAITLTSTLVGLIQNQREEEKLENEKTIESYKANREKAKSLEELYEKYKLLTSETSSAEEKNDELKSVEEDLLKLLGEKSTILKTLKDDMEKYTQAVKDMTEAEIAYYRDSLHNSAVKSEKEMAYAEIGGKNLFSLGVFKNPDGIINRIFEKHGIDTYNTGIGYYEIEGTSNLVDSNTKLQNFLVLQKMYQALETEMVEADDDLSLYIKNSDYVSDVRSQYQKDLAQVNQYFDLQAESYVRFRQDRGDTIDDVNEALLATRELMEEKQWDNAYFDRVFQYVKTYSDYYIKNQDGNKDPKGKSIADPLTDENTRKEIIAALEKERDLQKESEEYAKHLQAIEEARTISAEKRAEIAEKTKKIEEAQLKIAEAEANLAEKKKKLEEATMTFKVRAYDHKTGLFKWDISMKDVQAAKREKDDAEIDLHNAKVDLQDAVLEQKDAIQKFEDYLRENDEAIREAEQNLQIYLKEEAFSKVIDKLGEETTTTSDILEILQNYVDLGLNDNDLSHITGTIKDTTGTDLTQKIDPADAKKTATERIMNELDKDSVNGENIRDIFQYYLSYGKDMSFVREISDDIQNKTGTDVRTLFDLADLRLPDAPLYDNGGVLHGIGGIKATKEDEGIIPPPLMKKILKPDRVAEFERFLAQVNHALELAHISNNPMIYRENPLKHAEFRNIANYDRHDRQYIVNGVPISERTAETMTMKQIFETMALIQ